MNREKNAIQDPAIANAVALIHLLQSKMTDEQRVELWSQISEGYCKVCGIKLSKQYTYCPCENDE